jgi:hypothetical protein
MVKSFSGPFHYDRRFIFTELARKAGIKIQLMPEKAILSCIALKIS